MKKEKKVIDSAKIATTLSTAVQTAVKTAKPFVEAGIEAAKAAVAEVKDQMTDVKETIKESIDLNAQIEAKCKAKREKKLAEQANRERLNQLVTKTIDTIRNNEDVEEIYIQRSGHPDAVSLGGGFVNRFANVTVVGIVYKENDAYSMNIAFARRNPNDQFNKRLGYGLAASRAAKPFEPYTIGNRELLPIQMKGFDTPILKNYFFAVADEIINEFEYSVVQEKKALANNKKFLF